MAERLRIFYKKGGAYLKELRRAPEARRKRWLVATTTVAMLGAFGLWLLYLNLTLPTLPPASTNAPSSTTPAAPAATAGPSFLQTLGLGLQVSWQQLDGQFQGIKNRVINYLSGLVGQIQKTNRISIEAQPNNFEPNNLGQIPTTTLP